MKISVIGLGYVGLPLAIEVSHTYHTVGFDLDKKRVNSLNSGFDKNLQFEKQDFRKLKKIKFTSNQKHLLNSNIFFVTVPTPIISGSNTPNLSLIKSATELISKVIEKGNIIVLESTVYPGVTRNFIGNIIKKKTKFRLNEDFYLAYSPERINPGDKKTNIKSIRKIIGASNRRTLEIVSKIYESFLEKKI